MLARLVGRKFKAFNLQTVCVAAALLCLSILTLTHVLTDSSYQEYLRKARIARAAQNETLGFGEIVYISMPHRTDRQDAMNLLASWTGIRLRHLPGVDGSKIDEKAKPDFTPEDMTTSVLGCWRAHANAWREMLDSKVETMLVLEDDIDWDVNIHDIMERFSFQMQNNSLRTHVITPHERDSAPYGLDWDLINMGQCYNHANPDRPDLFITYPDPTAPPIDSLSNSIKQFLEFFKVTRDEMESKRLISPSFHPICTMAYALTRRGAQRLLLHSSYAGLHGPVDLEISDHAGNGKIHAYDLSPPPFNSWRVDGKKDSDNNARQDPELTISGTGNLGGRSMNLRTSARKDMVRRLTIDNWRDYDVTHPIVRNYAVPPAYNDDNQLSVEPL
ncbi:hypothetical protein BZA70DRAFT_86345 [Myxozyma melibiosi]|uniref:Glycosyl transferase family 25 domain-containing protein n=1 Tax=Myxozyma melibiosi TaxID=54550 RepID=A0ABR1F1E0_9ASCO